MNYRLSRSSDIQLVYQQGVKFYHPLLRCVALTTKLPSSRFAVVTSTRIDKRAVVRNRLRRWLRPELRQQLSEKGRPSVDLVCIVQPKAAKTEHAQLSEALAQLMQKVKRL